MSLWIHISFSVYLAHCFSYALAFYLVGWIQKYFFLQITSELFKFFKMCYFSREVEWTKEIFPVIKKAHPLSSCHWSVDSLSVVLESQLTYEGHLRPKRRHIQSEIEIKLPKCQSVHWDFTNFVFTVDVNKVIEQWFLNFATWTINLASKFGKGFRIVFIYLNRVFKKVFVLSLYI